MYQFANTLGLLKPILHAPAREFVFLLERIDQNVFHCKFQWFCQVVQPLAYHFAVEELQGMIDRGEIEFRPATLEELDAFYDALDDEEDQEDDDDETNPAPGL